MGAENAKAEAALKLRKITKPRRLKRRKRELIDLDLPSIDLEELDGLKATMKVSGSQGWAKLGPGSVKLVKRVMPETETSSSF